MIELKHLTKKYDHFLAVEDLNLKIETGEFFGLLGPNGAGKTTTIGMLSTLLLPTSGEIWINGELLTRQKNHLKPNRIVVTQEYSMRQDMTMNEIMEYQGRLYYMPLRKIRERSEELLEFCGLIDYRKRTVRKLSGGMKRKLMVCRALLTEPEILLLDEPTAGLDPKGRDEILDQIAYLHEKADMTVILVSHSMEDIAKYVDRIIVMNKGSVMFNDVPKKVFAHYKELESVGLAAPQVTYIMHALKEKGMDVPTDATTIEEAADGIMKALKKERAAK